MMPILFVGHGNPMNAIDNNSYTESWENLGKSLPKPKSIMVISAHWQTRGTKVTVSPRPRTIYDFYGFPPELSRVVYPAPGDTEMAYNVIDLSKTEIMPDKDRGFDHGTWTILHRMFKSAQIPVFQISLNTNFMPKNHFDLGKELSSLRENGVLIVGSGNIVHNLSMMRTGEKNYEWATMFDELVSKSIQRKDFDKLINYEKLGSDALLSIPTSEHYLPLLYILGAVNKDDNVVVFNNSIDLASISMTSYLFNS